MQETAHAPEWIQAPQQAIGKPSLFPALSRRIPFGFVRVLATDKSGLSAHTEPHVTQPQVGVHAIPQLENAAPLRLGIRLGDAGPVDDTGYPHRELELCVDFVGEAF